MVDEASTSFKCYQSFPPDLDALLKKDPFVVLCLVKAKPSSISLGGCDGGQSMMSYMVWGKEKKKRRRGLIGGASKLFKFTSPQSWTHSMLMTCYSTSSKITSTSRRFWDRPRLENHHSTQNVKEGLIRRQPNQYGLHFISFQIRQPLGSL
ncbi:unnamed protein product [Linum trigynum]|uniref:Uncharacterized protein n=1 Tax=Linum trigynum TaxID=586398 RepID=A0AAV2DYI8_9ROSI